MSFEVDRCSAAWAHIALCADLTWTTEPPDEFIIANQRLWAQHRRVSQVLQDSAIESQSSSANNNQCELTDKSPSSSQTQENGSCSGRRRVKEVIPESRLAQYGNFYYDDVREKFYTNPKDKVHGRGYHGQGCDNTDVTECWMLPEVEYWFRKLLDDTAERSVVPRRRRQYRMLADDDFERWGPVGARAAVTSGEETALAARVSSVRPLWGPQPRATSPRASWGPGARTPSPPAPTRKMRSRRRQPRRITHLPPPLAYCLEAPVPLLCDPSCKFQFDAPPRPPRQSECQRAIWRLSASVQAVVRASAARYPPPYPPYRGTTVSRYAPTSQRPARCPDRRYLWWPRDHPSPRLDNKFRLTHLRAPKETPEAKPQTVPKEDVNEVQEETTEEAEVEVKSEKQEAEAPESPKSSPKEKFMVDGQVPSTSTAADAGLSKKRLYSTVLSMSAPAPIILSQVGSVRLSQKLVTPGLLKLNPKIVPPSARIRPVNVNNKFEELEKEALEQYKPSDESIDTKFRELEKEAAEQYSNSNSNTSCDSGNSTEKRAPASPALPEAETRNKSPAKFPKAKSVDSVVIYSQNFPDAPAKPQATSGTNLKNFHTPPRGEKKEQVHRPWKGARSSKSDSQRAASDTDNDARESSCKGSHKGSRWTLHGGPPKKRHLTLCVSDFSSDEEVDAAIVDAGPRLKSRAAGQAKMSAHGGGDLQPILRKT